MTKSNNNLNTNNFEQLFSRYSTILYRFAISISGDQLIAEEAVQNTFIKIWRNGIASKTSTEFEKLIFTYTKNAVIDELRKTERRKKHENQAFIEIKLNENSIPEEKLRLKAILESAIDQLPNKAKEIFRLSKQEGLNNTEIANFLNISVKTVENQMTNANKRLRDYLIPFKKHLEI